MCATFVAICLLVSPPMAELQEHRDNANREYQLGRAAFERGDLSTAEPHFLKAAEWAPAFPEPHFALAQIFARMGRQQEAQLRMARAQKQMPAAPPAGSSTTLLAQPQVLSTLARKAAKTMPASHQMVGRALCQIAVYMEEGRLAIAPMAASAHPQDQHNARIHMKQHIEAEGLFRQLTQMPIDANLWWQLALSAFNLRREYMTASVAFAVTALLSTAPMVLMSFYLLFHAWQHLCDWREWDGRLRMLATRVHVSLGDEMLPDTGPGNQVRWAQSNRSALVRTGESEAGNGNDASAASSEGLPAAATAVSATQASNANQRAAGVGIGGPNEIESLVLAMESPYIFLVSRLADTAPPLLNRIFARQAQLQKRSLDAEVRALAASTLHSLPPSHYVRDGQIAIAYLSGLPAGHVTYDLVGSMLRFHSVRHLKPYWCTAAVETAPVTAGNSGRGGLKVQWPHIVELSRMQPLLAAERLRKERIAVLIDLDGWIGDEPPRALMSSYPAPLRSQWLGWAGTIADPSISQIVTDVLVSPPVHLELYHERLLVGACWLEPISVPSPLPLLLPWCPLVPSAELLSCSH